uniref:Retrotransposon protein, putative, unclassified n=1 Tax=Tanacetum cinerariifolium TaxID=118510 RepID=A0A6L2LW97_TANCI|nr:retrotransposon protein, putative, unclassified [Tanacetum cinerariifolium]
MPIPSWVNRLARLGFLCNCVLPAGLNETKVRQIRAEDGSNNEKKLRSQSSRFASSSKPQQPPLSSRSSNSATRKNSPPKTNMKPLTTLKLNRGVRPHTLREYCDRNYHQLLPIIAEKVHQKKVQQEKLKAVKARLNFEEVSQHSESGTPSGRRDLRKRLGSRRICSVFGSPKPRRGRPESPRKRDPERKAVFKRLEKGVFQRLGDKGKSMSAHSNDSRRQLYHSSRRDTEGCYQSSRSRGTEPASEKHHNKRASSYKTKALSESESRVCEETDLFTPRIRYFDLSKRTRMPSHVKTYDRSKNPEDHLKIFLAAAKVERWAMPTWCHMFNSTLIGSTRKKCITDPVEIHHVKQREGESTEDFMRRFKVESRDVKGAPEIMRISGFMHGITNPELIKHLHDKIPKSVDVMVRITTSFLRGRWQLVSKNGRSHFRHGNIRRPDISRISRKEVLKISKGQSRDKIGPEGQPRAAHQPIEEIIKVAINPDYPEQTIMIGSNLTEEGRNKLCHLVQRNLDVFAWKPADMTGVPRHIAEHRLNIQEGCPPVWQKRRSQAANRNQAIQEEVEKIVDVGIMKEVHYHIWLSNLFKSRSSISRKCSSRNWDSTTSNELDLLFSSMIDELLNGSTQVVSKYSAVTTADATNKYHSLEQVIGNPSQSVRTRRHLESDGEMWELKFFLGIQIHQSPRGIFINQAKYDQEILIKHGMTSCDSVGTPMATKHLDADLSETPVDQTKYRSMVGALMYLTTSRPDIVHATCYCAHYQAKPSEKHLTADCTSMSLAEAKYVFLSACCAQVLWMRTQLTDYGFHFDKIPMYCDSKAAIAISCNLVQHSRTKHIDVRYHFIKEKVEKCIVELFFVGTEYQLADMFTKALSEDRFKYLVRRLGMRCLTPKELEVLTNESA